MLLHRGGESRRLIGLGGGESLLGLVSRAVGAHQVDEADVLVVGAGLAGLVAARRLVAAGLRPVVVEARSRVGGRLLGEPIGGGDVVELGGQWVGPTQGRILGLVRELGLATFPTYDEGRSILEVGGRRSYYEGGLSDFSLSLVRELSRGLSLAGLGDFEQGRMRLDRSARGVPLEEPWRAKGARRLDAETFASWVHRNCRTATARTLWELACEAVFACEPADVSLLHVLFYVHSAGGWNLLLGTVGGAQQDRIRGGSQRIPELLAAELGDAVRLGQVVSKIEHGAAGVSIHTRADGSGEGMRVRARRAIVAIPPTLAGRIDYEPPLPALRDQLTQRMPQGSVIKTMAIHVRPFWRDEGLSGQVSTDVGPARVIFDNSPPEAGVGVLLGFLEGRAAREWAGRPAAERREAVLAGQCELFGPSAARPEQFVEKVWAEEQWTRGCYGCLMTTGAWTGFGAALRRPVGPLHWAGAETATVWSGYMDGAVQSGERVAAEVVAAIGSATRP